MTEFQKLVKNAPNFVSMEHGELVVYAYAMYATAVNTEVENVDLRKLVEDMWKWGYFDAKYGVGFIHRMQKLGIEVPGVD